MIQRKHQKIFKNGKYHSFPDYKVSEHLVTSSDKVSHPSTQNCVRNSPNQAKCNNSNMSPSIEDSTHQSFVDPELASLVNNLVDKVASKSPNEKLRKGHKLQKQSSAFLMKNSLNNSLASTSGSDDSNSCERASILSAKGFRSDSINSVENIKDGNSQPFNSSSKNLFKIPEQFPEQSPNGILEQMMQAVLISDNNYNSHQATKELEDPNSSSKKPVPNKYKTEICRNWEVEGFCRFGDECTFAHGDFELNRKASMPSNYKTKVCTQFTEDPFYCPYGEKCQFLHITFVKSSQTSNKPVKYSEILNETLKQLEKRIMHLDNFENFEIPEAVFRKQRLSVFKDLTNGAKEIAETQPNSLKVKNSKKSALNMKSREFHMPKKNFMEYSVKKDDLATGRTT